MTISEAFERRIVALLADQRVPKTIKNYNCALNTLLNSVGDIPIELFGKDQVLVWTNYMHQEGLVNTTIRGYQGSMRSVLGYLIDEFDMKVMLPRKIKSPPNDSPPKPTLTSEELVQLIDACRNPRDKAIAALVFLSAGRISEVLNIEKEQFIEAEPDEKGRIEIEVCGKGKKWRPLFVTSTAQKYVNDYLETRRNPKTGKLDYCKPLFISGQRRQITVSRVEQVFHRAASDAGITKHVTPHVLRHSKTTELLEKGAPIELVSKMLGHSNVAITSKIYSHVRTKSQKDMLDEYSTPLVHNFTPPQTKQLQ
jgi:integrase/recombinase XerD